MLVETVDPIVRRRRGDTARMSRIGIRARHERSLNRPPSER